MGNAAHLYFNDNLLINEIPFRGTTVNLLRNHNLERNEDWVLINENDPASGSYVDGTSYHGNKSLKITKEESEGLNYYRQETLLKKGYTYTLSAYLKTSDVYGSGARLLVRYKDAANVWKEELSVPVDGFQDWQRLCHTFTVPETAASVTVHVGLALRESTGTVWFDCIQLEEGSAPTGYNLVENSSLELDADENGIPDLWSPSNLGPSDVLCTGGKFDSRSFRITGEPGKNKYISQKIQVAGQADETFIISCWARAKSVPRTENKNDRKFGLCLAFYGETTVWKWVYFNDDYSDWQYTSGVVKAPIDYDYIRCYGIYYKNANNAYFDGFQVNKEKVTTYSYDEKGYITSIKDSNNAQTKFKYNEQNDLVKAIDPKGGNYLYQYDDKHNLLSAQSPTGTSYSMSYDSSGNITAASCGHQNNPNLIRNGDFEAGCQSWYGVMSSDYVNGIQGPKAMKLTGSTTCPHAEQEILVEPNTEYTLSGEIKTYLNQGKAFFEVLERNSSGNLFAFSNEDEGVTGYTPWTKKPLTFTTGPNTTKIRVTLRLAGAEPGGYALFDAIQLEKSAQVSAYNILENAGFELGTGLPTSYKKVIESGNPTFSFDTTDYKEGKRSLKISATNPGKGYLDIDKTVYLKPNTTYTLSFWVKGNGLASNTTIVSLSASNAEGQGVTEHVTSKVSGAFDWRNITETFTTSSSDQRLNGLKLGLISSSSGKLLFDAVTLKEEGIVVKAQYTSDRNYLKKIYDVTGEATTTYNYEPQGLITGEVSSIADAKGYKQSYTYDDLSRVTGVKDNVSNTEVMYTYNNLDCLASIKRSQFDYLWSLRSY